MSFQYMTGTSASIADWFIAFQNWVVGLVGWTVEQGAWTTDLIIRSLGEDSSYTMLWARVWNVPATNTIGVEVRDDLAGTHQTNEGGRLNAGVGAFDYWMSADKEGFHITFKNAVPQWSHIYGGCALPFALGLADETYMMVVTDDNIIGASILRNHDGAWDVDIGLFWDPLCDNIRKCPADNSFSLMGIYVNDGSEIAGQIPNMSGWINDGTIAVETAITTQGEGTNSTTWIVLQGSLGVKFAQRTGGDKPSGVPEGSFAHETGIAPSPQNFIEVILPAFMGGIGWQDLGDPGLHTWGRLFHSTGESGADDIYVLICYEIIGNDYFYSYVQDDAIGTNRTAGVYTQSDVNNFPALYYLSGDRDCVTFAVGSVGNDDVQRNWAGKVVPANRNLAASPYHMVTWAEIFARRYILRDHSGAWNQAVFVHSGADAAQPLRDTSPNDFDGLTYILLPYYVLDAIVGGYDFIGQIKYLYEVSGCIAQGDIIPVADREYRVFREGTHMWAMRVA